MIEEPDTEAQFLDELARLRRRVAELEASEAERERVEQAPRHSEEYFRSLIENVTDIIIEVDGDGIVRYQSPSLERVLGYRPSEWEGVPLWELIHPDDQPATRRALDLLALNPGEARLIAGVRARQRDGSWRSLEAVGRCFVSPAEQKRIVLNLRDVAERSLAEAAGKDVLEGPRESERKFRTIIEQSAEGFVLADSSGRIVEWNQAMEKITGLKRSAVIGLFLWDLMKGMAPPERYSSERYEELKNGTLEALRTGVSLFLNRTAEVVLQRADGERRIVQQTVFVVEFGGERFLSAAVADITERHQAELQREAALEELRESQQMLRLVLDTIPTRVFWKDRDLKYRGCNRSLAADLGLESPDDIVGRDDYEFASAQQAEVFRADDSMVIATGTPKLDFEERKGMPTGELVWLRTSKAPLLDAEGRIKGVLGTYEDITARKQAEFARETALSGLRREKSFSDALLDSLPGVFYLYDDQRRLIRWNKKHEQLTGYSPKETATHDWFGAEDRKRIVATAREVFERGQAVTEACLVTKDGRRLPHYFTGTRLTIDGRAYLVGIGIDISERRQAEAALEQSEERYRSLFEGVPIGLYRTTPAGRILDANPALLAMLGYPDRESLLARSAYDIVVHPEDRARQLELLLRGGDVRHYEMQFRGYDGRLIWVRDTARCSSASGPADGELQFIEGSLEDVTERKRLEAQFLQAQKMETVGRLAGGVAHDFGNLLTAIGGYAAMVKIGLRPDHPAQSDVDQIIRAAERAGVLTRQLLAFSREQVIEQESVDLNQLILDMDKMLCRLIGEDIELNTTPGADLGLVQADPGKLEQVLVNLVVNARDAMPRGGNLMIQTANRTLDEEYARQHMGVSPGEHVMLTVTDTGTGMTEEIKAHIFEPFFTTKEEGKGTGLGLSTVYGIVKQHQGTIWVYSEPGRGSTFKIYLPRAVRAAPPVRRAVPDLTSLPRGGETILLAEDDAIMRGFAVRTLSELGYSVLPAANAMEAEGIFRARTSEIDLLFTDVIMPKVNGRELADRLRAECPGLKVLYTSGYTDESIVRRGILRREEAFLQKPFTTFDLARKVYEVLHSP